jgi:hypothetical protein
LIRDYDAEVSASKGVAMRKLLARVEFVDMTPKEATEVRDLFQALPIDQMAPFFTSESYKYWEQILHDIYEKASKFDPLAYVLQQVRAGHDHAPVKSEGLGL